MNDEYTHSTQSPLEGPKYIKKDMHKIKAKKTAEHLVNKYNKWNKKMKIRRVKSLANIHLTWDKHMKCDGVTSVTWALNPPPECRPVIKNKNK